MFNEILMPLNISISIAAEGGNFRNELFECCGLLYEFPAETRLTVYRRLVIPNRSVFEKARPRPDP